jgi:hypothetical protein
MIEGGARLVQLLERLENGEVTKEDLRQAALNTAQATTQGSDERAGKARAS